MDAAFWGGIRQACDKAEAGGPLFGIDSEAYAMWKANSGNARARRRWRRRNIPNSQREGLRRATPARMLASEE